MTKHDKTVSQRGGFISDWQFWEMLLCFDLMSIYAGFEENWRDGSRGFDSLHPLHFNKSSQNQYFYPSFPSASVKSPQYGS